MNYYKFFIAALIFKNVIDATGKTLPMENTIEKITDISCAVSFLKQNDILNSKYKNFLAVNNWNYENDITEESKNKLSYAQQLYGAFQRETWEKVATFAWEDFQKYPKIYRWFKSLSISGYAALPREKFNKLNSLVSSMKSEMSTTTICYRNETHEKCGLILEPDLADIFSKSRDYDELEYLWLAWRNASGKKIKDRYIEYVKLSNEAAILNGLCDAGEVWRELYESKTFTEDIEKLWKTITPFYQQLHAYVRSKLMEIYPGKIRPDGPIPAHLLGSMFAQMWNDIFDLVKPYPDKADVDITSAMQKKKMTQLDMFKMAEEFFTSLGLEKFPETFWNNSVMVKPTDREIVCHASAKDFFNAKDFRIKMCTLVNIDDFTMIHHEMGHIQYYMQYSKQPVVFRNGANPGFHEAIGDTIALSVSTPIHLRKIGLLNNSTDDTEMEINYLLNMALIKTAFIPFAYILDLWRWNVFSGRIEADNMNTAWWKMRLRYQGVCPPVKRTEEDFDPAAKFHLGADIPYIRYFVSFIIQFQFHEALCNAAGHTGPLHKCDIYKSKEAGKLLSMVLKAGSSIPWKEAMRIITKGTTSEMDAGPLLRYFSPLIKWLKDKNKNNYVGWKSNDPTICP